MEVKVTLPAGEAEYFSRYNDFTAGWTTQESWFDSRYGKDISILFKIQSGSGAHPEFYSVGFGGALQEDKSSRGPEADHSPPFSSEIQNDLDCHSI
jgi:hypothetical protein